MLTAQITCVLPVAIKTEPSACGAISGVTRHSRSPSPVRFELRRRVSGCGLFSMFSVSGKRDNNAGRAKSQGKDGIEPSAWRQCRSLALSATVFDSGPAAAYLRKHKAQLCAELTRPAGTFESSPVGSAGKWCERRDRPARDDGKRSALRLANSLTIQSAINRPIRDVLLEKRANPALRTGLLSSGPFGIDFSRPRWSLCAILTGTSYVGAQGSRWTATGNNAGSTQQFRVDPCQGLVQFPGSPLW